MQKKLIVIGIAVVVLAGLVWTGWSIRNYFAVHYTAWRELKPAMRLELHNFDPERPIADRIAVVSSDVVRTLWPDGVQPYTILPGVKAKIVSALDTIMTPELEAFLKARLVGIAGFIIKDGYYGYSHLIIDDKGVPYFYISFDLLVFQGVKGNSPPSAEKILEQDARWVFASTLEEFLEYALLHEIGHGVDWIFGINDGGPGNVTGLHTAFAGPIKYFGDDEWEAATELKNVEWNQQRLLALKAFQTPSVDEKTIALVDFFSELYWPTFYALTNQKEDWADTWAHWHWVRRLKRDSYFEYRKGSEDWTPIRYYENPLLVGRLDEIGRFYENEFQVFLTNSE